MKVVIYGIGTVFHKHIDLIEWSQVIAVVDKFPREQSIHGFTVMKPSILTDLDYDYIVVFSNKLFLEIQQELTFKYNADIYKIVSWRFYTYDTTFSHSFITRFFNETINSVLDIFPSPLSRFYYSKESISQYLYRLYGFHTGEETFIPSHFYDNIYEKISNKVFDLIWVHVPELEHLKKWIETKNTILVTIPYSLYKNIDSDYWKSIANCADIHTYSDEYLFILYIKPFNNYQTLTKKESISFYVMIHKKIFLYPNNSYIGLKIGDREFLWNGLIGNSNNNIEHLNAKINECTGLYWLWKNDKSDIVGLNHYRRYFLSNEIENVGNILLPKEARQILKKYDIILPKTEPLTNCSVLEEIQYSLSPEAFREGLDIILEFMKKNCPEYIANFWKVMNGHYYFHFNMFITHRDIMEQYCTWLFSFLIEAAEYFDISNYNCHEQRTIGFFAERMWTVWLYDKTYKIKELPVLCIMSL